MGAAWAFGFLVFLYVALLVPDSRHWRRFRIGWLEFAGVALAVSSVMLTFVDPGPPVPFDPPRSPDAVGVVRTVDHRDSVTTYELDSGGTVEVDINELDGPTGSPGELLLYADGDPPLHVRLHAAPVEYFDREGCYLMGEAAREEGPAIAFANGLLLRKADGFHASSELTDDGYWLDTRIAQFCINRNGEVVQQGSG